LGRLLWAERQAESRQAARQARLTELQAQSGDAAAAAIETSVAAAARRRERARLSAAQSRHATRRAARQEKITALEGQWTQLTAQAAQTQQTVSRLENLIRRQMVRLDTGPKRLLDAIQVTARNEFYRAVGPFRAASDNYRDLPAGRQATTSTFGV
jgi:chromosome segregation ATPase